jgi:parallel beta-helix repeat protein
MIGTAMKISDKSILFGSTFFLALASTLPLAGQTLMFVDFENRISEAQSNLPYTESNVELDFGELDFSNGVDEGRVSFVTGSEAYGGSGTSMRVSYPAGGVGPREGGAQWLVEFDTEVEEAYLSYRVKFGDGFDFVRGGKLPGLAGGSAPSGSAPADGIRGWTGRLMWRTDFGGSPGQPNQQTTQGISYAKHVNSGFEMDGRQEDEEFWFDRDGNEVTMQSGVWYTIRQRVRLNTPGVRDGILQIWLDGRLVLSQSDLQFRNTADLKVDRFFFSTFFGGGSGWESSRDEVVFFDDFHMSSPQILEVPADYPTVGAAVDAANPGDVVLLGNANWYANLVINQPLTLRGRDDSRLMGARGNQPVVQVNSDSVNIERLRIARGAAGVVANSSADDLKIQNCDFRNNFGDGIRATGCRGINIRNNSFCLNEGRGVFLDQADGFNVYNCLAKNNGGAGFEIFSDGGFVSNCEAINNRAGAGFFFIGSNSGFVNNNSVNNNEMGFLLVSGSSIGFTNNRAENNALFGFLAFGIDNSLIAENLFETSGDVGAILDNSNNNAFQFNTSSFNSGIGAYFSPSTSGNYSGFNSYEGNRFALGLVDEGNNTVDN